MILIGRASLLQEKHTTLAGLGVEITVSQSSISILEQTFRVCLDEVELGLGQRSTDSTRRSNQKNAPHRSNIDKQHPAVQALLQKQWRTSAQDPGRPGAASKFSWLTLPPVLVQEQLQEGTAMCPRSKVRWSFCT